MDAEKLGAHVRKTVDVIAAFSLAGREASGSVDVRGDRAGRVRVKVN